MSTEIQIYYSLYDAECAADEYAQRHGGLVVGMQAEMLPLRGTIMEDDPADHVDDRFTKNVGTRPGTLEAVRVIDKETLKDIALFGYHTDEID